MESSLLLSIKARFFPPLVAFGRPSPLRRAAAGPPRLLCSRGGAAFTVAPLVQDAGATALVMAGAYALVLSFESLTKRNFIEQDFFYCSFMPKHASHRDLTRDAATMTAATAPRPRPRPSWRTMVHPLENLEQSLSRKVVHVLSGVLFMSSWPIFSSSMEARYFAATAPILNCLRLLIYGLSLVTDEGLVKSISREGKPEELLRGPLYYVLVLLFCTLVFWRESPVGVVILAMMSGGDGFADIVGRRFGAFKLPYNRQKSWSGSIAMFVSGFLLSIGMLYYFSALGFIHLDWGHVVGKVALVSLAATAVESLPISDVIDDNISVPLSSMLTAFLVFGYVPSQ